MREIVESLPIRDQVADIIRQMIISGELLAGQKISERQISTQLNVSTTPVKEAFRSLQAEKLIITIPRKGSFISDHSKENLKEITYIRSAMDGVAAYFAAAKASKAQIAEMKEILKKARTIIEQKGDSEELAKCNEQFHALLREASNNQYISSLASSFLQIDSSIRKVANVVDSDRLMIRQQEHERILQAIENGDSKGVEQLMVEHIRITYEGLSV